MPPLKLLQITIFLLLFSSLIQAENPTNSRKLDQNPQDFENKCGDCPCDKPCNPQPSPPPPSPPPPPSSPPPPKNPPTTPNYECPPPPPPAVPSGQKPPKGSNPPYIYINAPPGSVYPVYATFSGAGRRFLIGKIPFLIGFVLWVLPF